MIANQASTPGVIGLKIVLFLTAQQRAVALQTREVKVSLALTLDSRTCFFTGRCCIIVAFACLDTRVLLCL